MSNILFVDDNQTIIDNLSRFLEIEGYTVFKATNSREAIDIYKKESIDLIISDIMMENKDAGYELYKKISEFNVIPPTPFVFLSARTDEESLRDGMNLGAADYLKKPVESKNLINVVKRRLEQSNKINQNFTSLTEAFRNQLPDKMKNAVHGLFGFSEMIDMALEENEIGVIKEYIQKIKTNLMKLSDHIERLLNLGSLFGVLQDNARLQEIRNDFDKIDAYEVILLAINSSKYLMNHKNRISILKNELIFESNSVYISMFLKEVIENAIKFSPKDSIVEITITTAEDGNVIKIKNLFDDKITKEEILRSYSFSSSREYKYLGTEGIGIGYSIIRALGQILMLKWDIEIKNNEFFFIIKF